MKIKFFLSLFFVIFIYTNSICQNRQIDSLFILEVLRKIKVSSNLKNYEKAIVLSKNIIKRRKDKLGEDYYRLGYYFKENKEIDSAYYYYLKSSKLHFKNKDTIRLVKQLFVTSLLESDQEFYNKSDSSAVSALKYLKNKNKLFSSLYNCLAINSRHKHEYKEAFKWYDLGIKTSLDSIKKIRYLNNKAIVYFDLNNFDEAVSIFNRIKESKYYDSIPLKLKAKIIDNKAYAKFSNEEDVKESEFLEAQKIKIKIKDNKSLITNYSYLSDFHKKTNISKALEYAYKMYKLAKKVNLSKDRIEALDKIISLEDNFKIKKFARERNRLSDSLQLAKQQSQNKFAKIIYNYEEEEKQKLKAQVALEKQKTQKAQLIFGSIIIFILFLIYLIYKHQKTKKEKVIEVYKTETRLAKKIHDELANDVYLVMNKAQNNAISKEALLPDLEKIYMLTRDISHENSGVDTGNKFENHLKQLFTNFNNDTCKILVKGVTQTNVNSLSKDKQIIIYRVLHELLVNMDKHSKATLVVISFSEVKGMISINYKDNGVGIDLLKNKNGLQNMETRIKSIDGLFSFDSEGGNGFKANIQFKK